MRRRTLDDLLSDSKVSLPNSEYSQHLARTYMVNILRAAQVSRRISGLGSSNGSSVTTRFKNCWMTDVAGKRGKNEGVLTSILSMPFRSWNRRRADLRH